MRGIAAEEVVQVGLGVRNPTGTAEHRVQTRKEHGIQQIEAGDNYWS